MSDAWANAAAPYPTAIGADEKGLAPSNATLAQILSERRMKMLSELRDLEQALEALEKQPEFEPTMNRVMKILQRRY